MERANSNVGVKLPIGYRFHPTDEELVVHYLRRKALALPLPASIIPEFDVFKTDPWSLPGDVKEKRYFFSKKIGNIEGDGDMNKSKRGTATAAGCGYWKPIGKGKAILASNSNHIVGVRKTLVFFHEKEHYRSNNSKTQWIMHQYRLVASAIVPNTNHQICKVRLGDWVVYRIFQRKRRPNNKRQGVIFSSPSVIDYTAEGSCDHAGPPPPPQASSPCPSEVTEVSTNGLDQDQEISSMIINSFSS